MKIRPKIPIFYEGGTPVSGVGRTSSDWYNHIHLHLWNYIKQMLKKYGKSSKYADWLNSMQHAHSYIYNEHKNRMDNPIFDLHVQNYQKAYSGNPNFYPYVDPGVEGPELPANRERYLLYANDHYNFNNLGIQWSFDNNIFTYPGKRTSGDNSDKGYNPDGYFSGITDYRRLLGRDGDWDETSQEFKNWKKELNELGWDPYLDKTDGYYKLRRTKLEIDKDSLIPLKIDEDSLIPEDPSKEKKGSVDAITQKGGYGFDWSKIQEGASKIFGNPNLYAFGRLAGNLINNEKIYDEALKGILPTLRQSYNTHRQVLGDEATKQSYYRRAAQGQTKAARPFTSDADKLMAYQFEAKRIGDELRAQGDLADNLEIRRTFDESNQHQWANILRDTEVANANLASINQANSLRHNLLALKHASQWSSIDNFLLEIEYRNRQKQAENRAIDDLIFNLQEQLNLLDDDRIIAARENLLAVLDKHKSPEGGYDEYNRDVIEARKKYKAVQFLVQKESLERLRNYKINRNLGYWKSGTKITHKKKDDLLYKSAKDVVEHFRKMSKLSSDALNRKQPKIEKLTSHPKGKTKKYLLGGIAPFTVYKPVALGGETTTSSQTSTTKSAKENDGKDMLDMIKELFKALVGKGLPSDVNGLYISMLNFLSRAKIFGEEISTEDIASMYLSQILKLNLILYLKEVHDDAKKAVIGNDAVNEFAVDFTGHLVAQDKNSGEIVYVSSLREAKEKGLNPLTNDLLLQLRATIPSMAGRQELDSIAANGIGVSKIAEFLKSQIPNLGSSEQTILGYTKKESLYIREGLQQLLAEAPDGYYEYTTNNKNNSQLVKMAIEYLKNVLPNNMRKIIDVRAELGGLSSDLLIATLVTSNLSTQSSTEFTAVTGKAAKDANGNSKENSEGLKLDAATALITGKGYNTNIELNTGSNYAVNVKARYSEFLKHSGENMGAGITMLEASTSTLKGVLDWNKATLGGSTLNPTAYDYIVLNNGEVVGVDLPTIPGNNNIPNFEVLKQLEKLDDILLQKGILDIPENWREVNEICSNIGLPLKYDSQGKLNKLSWNRFAAFQVITTEKALNNKSVILDMLGTADDLTRDFYENIILKKTDNEKYSLDSGWPIIGGKEELYQGTVFVPVKNNLVAGAISSGLKISMTDATDLELRQRGYDLLKISTYKKNELVL